MYCATNPFQLWKVNLLSTNITMLAYEFWKEIWIFKSDWYNFHSIWPAEEFMGRLVTSTVKPVYNDHLMGYFSAFWSSSRWPRAILARVNWYLQSSLKHITELITGNKSCKRGGRYRQVSLYNIVLLMAPTCLWAYVSFNNGKQL